MLTNLNFPITVPNFTLKLEPDFSLRLLSFTAVYSLKLEEDWSVDLLHCEATNLILEMFRAPVYNHVSPEPINQL